MKTSLFPYASLGAALSILLLTLPGCWNVEQPASQPLPQPHVECKDGVCSLPAARVEEEVVVDSPVLVRDASGAPLVTEKDFQEALQVVLEAQPQLAQAMPFLPKEQQRELYNNILESYLTDNWLIGKFVNAHNLSASADAQRQRKQIEKYVTITFNNQLFDNYIAESLSLTDAQAEKFYNENKGSQSFTEDVFLLKKPGVKTVIVAVENDQQAQEVLAKARAEKDLVKAADQLNKKANELGFIDPQLPMLERTLAQALDGMKTFPAFTVVKLQNGTILVVQGTERQTAEYAPFDQVKEEVKRVMMSQEFAKKRAELLKDLRKEHGITVVDTSFVDTMLREPIAFPGAQAAQAGEAVA